MARRKIPSPADLQRTADNWNGSYPVGTTVSFEEIVGDGETHRGKTTGEAMVVGGHSVVIFLEGKSGYVSLEHCQPVA